MDTRKRSRDGVPGFAWAKVAASERGEGARSAGGLVLSTGSSSPALLCKMLLIASEDSRNRIGPAVGVVAGEGAGAGAGLAVIGFALGLKLPGIEGLAAIGELEAGGVAAKALGRGSRLTGESVLLACCERTI